jgi:hypothetical protein
MSVIDPCNSAHRGLSGGFIGVYSRHCFPGDDMIKWVFCHSQLTVCRRGGNIVDSRVIEPQWPLR